ncbi:hypothetical protein Vadar_008429 [Vaccinium darrowii]|uniref:Uncharacterized protein n=1 Tax=Vaccinium darrowii TaxID=229202 RepID=A0ACB7WYS6_9ERIC|nr:hypothetical protein Vadar_008429 [Vaccinium darrowii]
MLKDGLTVNASDPANLYFESKNTSVEIWADSISLQPFSEKEWKSHQQQSIEKKSQIKASPLNFAIPKSQINASPLNLAVPSSSIFAVRRLPRRYHRPLQRSATINTAAMVSESSRCTGLLIVPLDIIHRCNHRRPNQWSSATVTSVAVIVQYFFSIFSHG